MHALELNYKLNFRNHFIACSWFVNILAGMLGLLTERKKLLRMEVKTESMMMAPAFRKAGA